MFPLDPHIFEDDEFAAAETTNRPLNEAGPSGQSDASQTLRLRPEEEENHTEICQEEAGPSNSSSSRHPTTPCVQQNNNKGVDVKHVSPNDIMPLPRAQGTPKRRASNRGKTAVLTSSPYLNELKEKATQREKPQSVRSKRKLFEKDQANKKKLATSSKETGQEEENVECLFCKELYSSSKPGENWVLCSVCKNWANEICSFDSETHDVFICDFCT